MAKNYIKGLKTQKCDIVHCRNNCYSIQAVISAGLRRTLMSYAYAYFSQSLWQNSHKLWTEHKACQTKEQVLTAAPPRTMPLIVEHYLVVPCLSYGISARGSTPGSVLTRTWWGWPCLCLTATWGQVDTCSSRACSIIWTVLRQMGFWHSPISDL